MLAHVSFVLSQSTRLTDRQTDGRTDGQKGLGNTACCITCSRTVKTKSQTRRHITHKSSSLVVDLRIVEISIDAPAKTHAAPVQAVFLLGTDNGSMDGAEVPMSARRQHRSRDRDNWPITSHLHPFSPSHRESPTILRNPGSRFQPCLQRNFLTFFSSTEYYSYACQQKFLSN